MRFKSYEHFHLKTSTGQNDAWQSLVTVFANQWLDNININKYAKFEPNLNIL